MSIATECMTVNIHMGMWEARKQDKAAGQEVSANANAKPGTASVNKQIIPKEALAKIQARYSAIYNHVRVHTVPWKDNGDRLLSRKMWTRFIEIYEELAAAFNKEVNDWVENEYPVLLGKAQFDMGALFNPNDYPDPHVIKGKFYVRLVMDAVTEAGDFRCNLKDTDVADRIRKDIEANIGQRLKKAQGEVWGKLANMVAHYAERMKSDGRLYESTRDNLIELCDILPGLNVFDDPDLRAMGKEIKQRLGGYDTADLRKDKDLKSAAAAEADEILERMSGFLKAFNNDTGDDKD